MARKREFDWNLALSESRRALVLNPNLDQAHFYMAAAYYHAGYMEEALLEVEKGNTTVRGDGSAPPIETEDVTIRKVTIEFQDERVARVRADALPQRDDPRDPALPGYQPPEG